MGHERFLHGSVDRTLVLGILMNWLEYFESELELLSSEHRLRRFQARHGPSGRKVRLEGKEFTNWSSNDYLGLAHHPEILEQAHHCALKWGNGSAGSRHLGGDCLLNHEVEAQIAHCHKAESALLFNTGYQANLALGSALAPKGACIFADELCHASFWDGIRMGGTRFQRYKHRNLEHLEQLLSKFDGPKILCTESIFSMDGDLAPLNGLAEIAQKHQALLIIDEAHADGIFGSTGHGFCPDLRDQYPDLPLISLSTFGKAYGVFGAAICGPETIRNWLIQKARSLIFSTFMSPWNLGAISQALRSADEQDYRRAHTLQLATQFRTEAQAMGFHIFDSCSQIVPLRFGSAENALNAATLLQQKGHFVHPVRPPTVPEGQSRLRINLCAFHQAEDLEMLLGALNHLERI